MTPEEEQDQIAIEMEMAKAKAKAGGSLKFVPHEASAGKNDKSLNQSLVDDELSFERNRVSKLPDMIKSAAYGIPVLGPLIPKAAEVLGVDNAQQDWKRAASEMPLAQVPTALGMPNPLGFAGAAGRIGGGMIDAAERGYDNDGLEGAGIAAGATGAIQGGLEAAIPFAGKAIYKAMPSLNRAGNSILAKFLGLAPEELSRMSKQEVDEMMLALGMPKVENNQVVRPAPLTKWASRQDALDNLTGLTDDLGVVKGRLVESMPPVPADDISNTFLTHAQDPMMTGAEAQYARPGLSEMASRYGNMQDQVPMSMLSRESSELGNQVFSGANPSALDKAQNIGTLRAKGAVDEIINTTANQNGMLPDLQAANKGFANSSMVRENLLKTMNPAAEGQTAGFMNKMTDLAARGFTAVGGQRVMSTAGMGAKEIAADLLHRLPNSTMQTPDISRVARILQIIQQSDQPEVDFEVASQDPVFTRTINDMRKKDGGN